MNEQQLYLAIGVPIIVGVLFNGGFFLALNARISSLETSLSGRIGAVEARLAVLSDRIGELAVRLGALEIHVADLTVRVSALEAGQGRLVRS